MVLWMGWLRGRGAPCREARSRVQAVSSFVSRMGLRRPAPRCRFCTADQTARMTERGVWNAVHGERLERGGRHGKEQVGGVPSHVPGDSSGPHGPVLSPRGDGIPRWPDQVRECSGECGHRGSQGLRGDWCRRAPVSVREFQGGGSRDVTHEDACVAVLEGGRARQGRQVDEVGHATAVREAGQGCPLWAEVVPDGGLKGVLVHARAHTSCARGLSRGKCRK